MRRPLSSWETDAAAQGPAGNRCSAPGAPACLQVPLSHGFARLALFFMAPAEDHETSGEDARTQEDGLMCGAQGYCRQAAGLPCAERLPRRAGENAKRKRLRGSTAWPGGKTSHVGMGCAGSRARAVNGRRADFGTIWQSRRLWATSKRTI